MLALDLPFIVPSSDSTKPTTIRLRTSLRKRLSELARITGIKQQQILEAAVAEKLEAIERTGEVTIKVKVPPSKAKGKRPDASEVYQTISKPTGDQAQPPASR